ncbi:MAG: hypothetical protein AB7I79_14140 [Rhizobiaceae bacterium]
MKLPAVAAIGVVIMTVPCLAQDLPLVSATLDFAADTPDQADAFFEALRQHAGKPIRLALDIAPRQASDDVGYVVRPEPPDEQGEPVPCGTQKYGVIDNLVTGYSVSFDHPSNHHTITTIHVGDRQTFPFNGLICGVEDYTSKEFTHLHVSGAYIVVEAAIPTAVELTLFPYKP